MAIDQRLLTYIQDLLPKGFTPDRIKQSLLAAGWQETDIDEALGSTTPPIVPQVEPPQEKSPQPSRFPFSIKIIAVVIIIGLIIGVIYSFYSREGATTQDYGDVLGGDSRELSVELREGIPSAELCPELAARDRWGIFYHSAEGMVMLSGMIDKQDQLELDRDTPMLYGNKDKEQFFEVRGRNLRDFTDETWERMADNPDSSLKGPYTFEALDLNGAVLDSVKFPIGFGLFMDPGGLVETDISALVSEVWFEPGTERLRLSSPSEVLAVFTLCDLVHMDDCERNDPQGQAVGCVLRSTDSSPEPDWPSRSEVLQLGKPVEFTFYDTDYRLELKELREAGAEYGEPYMEYAVLVHDIVPQWLNWLTAEGEFVELPNGGLLGLDEVGTDSVSVTIYQSEGSKGKCDLGWFLSCLDHRITQSGIELTLKNEHGRDVIIDEIRAADTSNERICNTTSATSLTEGATISISLDCSSSLQTLSSGESVWFEVRMSSHYPGELSMTMLGAGEVSGTVE